MTKDEKAQMIKDMVDDNPYKLPKDGEVVLEKASARVQEHVNENIDPRTIVMDDDADMPVPETKDYEQRVKLTDKFIQLYGESVGTMKYATVLKNTQGNQIKLIDLTKFIEAKRDNMTLPELNTVVSFIANAEFRYVRPLMEYIESKEQQAELWQQI